MPRTTYQVKDQSQGPERLQPRMSHLASGLFQVHQWRALQIRLAGWFSVVRWLVGLFQLTDFSIYSEQAQRSPAHRLRIQLLASIPVPSSAATLTRPSPLHIGLGVRRILKLHPPPLPLFSPSLLFQSEHSTHTLSFCRQTTIISLI